MTLKKILLTRTQFLIIYHRRSLTYGIIPELIGRVSVIAPMHALSEQNMFQILMNLKMQS